MIIHHVLTLDDIDAAGVAFGPRLITLAHHGVERSLANTALDFSVLLSGRTWALPLVNIQADFKAPLRHGDHLAMDVVCTHVGNKSAVMSVTMRRGTEVVAIVQQTHVCLDQRTGQAVPWPEVLRLAWQTCLGAALPQG